jgi:hypothetical protein
MILGSLFTATFPMETISPAVGIGVRSMTAIFIILLTTLVPLTEVHAADKVRMRGAAHAIDGTASFSLSRGRKILGLTIPHYCQCLRFAYRQLSH